MLSMVVKVDPNRRTLIWKCEKCDAHNLITTKLRTGGKHQCFQARCKNPECRKTSRLASSWGSHIKASYKVTKRYKARECLQQLRGISDPTRDDYVRICGKKAVEMAEDTYGGEKRKVDRWGWVK